MTSHNIIWDMNDLMNEVSDIICDLMNKASNITYGITFDNIPLTSRKNAIPGAS